MRTIFRSAILSLWLVLPAFVHAADKPIKALFLTAGGDHHYKTIEFIKGSHALLKAKSPKDGREHIVCWTHIYGKGRVFATTLGHDMKTAQSPDYLRLLANGILWTCDK